ncbi:MAG: hypothetical protein ISR22_00785 [Candidatus Poseidoniaceae archaeon]|nr:hypothetical protein [Euryarchaeota archaeon]MBL6890570.1 hypothetical protein [Candidatus Poseidoniaceae archaeon]RAH05680.1 MAG: hypothetical protein CBC92_005080 [Euryarchaeota archaeon TMED132]
MFGGVITTLSLFGLIIGLTLYQKKKTESEGQDFDKDNILGEYGIETLLISIFLLWIVPWGIIIILPVVLLISLISPAGRHSWKQFSRTRIYVVLSLCMILFAGGFIPAPEPISPSEWGEPLLKENPNAPIFPSGNQYTWVMLPSDGGLNVEVVQSMKLRVPHQFSQFGSGSSSLDLADIFNMEQSRLKQAVELLDEQIVLSLDSEEMKLVEIIAADKHTYVDSGSGDEYNLDVRLYELRSLTLSSDVDGFKVGEVLCAASGTWGGEIDMLVVVRPISHTGIQQDRFAESLVSQWISSK